MINPHQPRDIPQILLSVLFLALIIISCLWVVQPFILSFAWAGTVVIATGRCCCVCSVCCSANDCWRCWR